MLRLCPFCDAQAIARRRPQWTAVRHASTVQSRPPSRMILAPHVGRGPASTTRGGKPSRRSRNSPFGGMNMTEPPRALQGAGRMVSATEQRRTGRHPKPKQAKEKGDAMPALKMQRALANVSYETRGRVKQALLARDRFEEFDLLPVIRESIVPQALGGLADVAPTPIQRLAIPALLGTEDGKRRRRKQSLAAAATLKAEVQQFLLAAETGSGKTLAYVLPTIDAIKRAEQAEVVHEQLREAQERKAAPGHGTKQALELDAPPVDEEPHPTSGRPRAIILLPTSELVAQVGTLIKSLSHTVKFRSALLSAAFTSTVIRNRLFSPGGVDVVVTTPHLLSSIAESDPNVLSRVTHLVVDEADSLLDRSFGPITSAIIDRATPSLQQLIFCSATIPRSLDSYLRKRFPGVKRRTTPNLHAIPRRVQLSVVDIDKVPYQGNRDLACAQTIWDIGHEGSAERGEEAEKKVVVFVNEREKTLELASYLRSKGIDATALSRDSDERKQAEVLAAFTGTSLPKTPPKQNERPIGEEAKSGAKRRPSSPSKRELRGIKVLVTTDLGSRGVDTILVRHVILYDVPHTSIDFIHRLGRVGRMGRRGRGVVLVGKHDRKDIVREVREGMFKGQALI